jgi:hypothetical protein
MAYWSTPSTVVNMATILPVLVFRWATASPIANLAMKFPLVQRVEFAGSNTGRNFEIRGQLQSLECVGNI